MNQINSIKRFSVFLLSRPWLVATVFVVVILLVLFFPLRYTSTEVNGNSFSGKITVLKAGQPLQQHIITPDKCFSAVVFWVKGGQDIAAKTPLLLEIYSMTDNQPIRSVKTTFAEAYQTSSGSLRLDFAPIRNSKNAEYAISLSVLNNSSQLISLRQPAELKDGNSSDVVVVPLVSKSLISIVLHQTVGADNTEGEDVYYYWSRGQEILKGGNPYLCALDSTCIDHKNPGHFPLFYWMSALSQRFGLTEYQDWIDFWRPIFIASWLIIGAFIFTTFYRKGQHWLALFGTFFWLFNRWSLYVLRVGQIDFLAILCLIVSLSWFKKYRWTSLILLSVSLALKQVAIFLVPLYLIIIWRNTSTRRIRALVLSVLLIASVPTITSLPFILNQPKAFVIGLLFSVNRTSESDLGAAALSRVLELPGNQGIIFMAALMALSYMTAWRRNIGLAISSLAVYVTFIAFNPVIFNQYLLWLAAIIPFAYSEIVTVYDKVRGNKKAEH